MLFFFNFYRILESFISTRIVSPLRLSSKVKDCDLKVLLDIKVYKKSEEDGADTRSPKRFLPRKTPWRFSEVPFRKVKRNYLAVRQTVY